MNGNRYEGALTTEALVEFVNLEGGVGIVRVLLILTTALKNEEDVVIVNLDADNTKDLAEKYGVSGYPKIKFFPKTNKDGEDYVGGHDIGQFCDLHQREVCLVKEFVSVDSDEKKAVYAKIEEEVGKLTRSFAR
nr:probable protein disulfide-isomerase A6 [Tanacetum cinerariifolium]